MGQSVHSKPPEKREVDEKDAQHAARRSRDGNEPNISRGKWPLARVVSVAPSSDGRIRVAVIRMSDGSTCTRVVGKLALLEAAR